MITFDEIYDETKVRLNEIVDAVRLENIIDEKLTDRFKSGRRDWYMVMVREKFSPAVCKEVAKRYRRAGWCCRWDGSSEVPFFEMKPSWWRTNIFNWFSGRSFLAGDI